MVLYNITKLTDASNVGELVLVANSEGTGGVLFGFFMVAIFLIILLALKRYSFENGFLVASFMSFIISSIAVYCGFLNIIFPWSLTTYEFVLARLMR